MVNLNLLPKRLRRRTGPDWWRTAAIVVPLVLFGIVAYVHLGTLARLNKVIDERDQLKAEVEILRPYIAEYHKLEKRRKELEAIAQVARKVRATFRPWSDYLAQFLTRLPARRGQLLVSLNSLSARTIEPEKAQTLYGVPAGVEFSLRGEAASDRALIDFVHTFETDPGFGINFQNANFDKKTKIYNFSASVGMVLPEKKTVAKAEGGAK